METQNIVEGTHQFVEIWFNQIQSITGFESGDDLYLSVKLKGENIQNTNYFKGELTSDPVRGNKMCTIFSTKAFELVAPKDVTDCCVRVKVFRKGMISDKHLCTFIVPLAKFTTDSPEPENFNESAISADGCSPLNGTKLLGACQVFSAHGHKQWLQNGRRAVKAAASSNSAGSSCPSIAGTEASTNRFQDPSNNNNNNTMGTNSVTPRADQQHLPPQHPTQFQYSPQNNPPLQTVNHWFGPNNNTNFLPHQLPGTPTQFGGFYPNYAPQVSAEYHESYIQQLNARVKSIADERDLLAQQFQLHIQDITNKHNSLVAQINQLSQEKSYIQVLLEKERATKNDQINTEITRLTQGHGGEVARVQELLEEERRITAGRQSEIGKLNAEIQDLLVRKVQLEGQLVVLTSEKQGFQVRVESLEKENESQKFLHHQANEESKKKITLFQNQLADAQAKLQAEQVAVSKHVAALSQAENKCAVQVSEKSDLAARIAGLQVFSDGQAHTISQWEKNFELEISQRIEAARKGMSGDASKREQELANQLKHSQDTIGALREQIDGRYQEVKAKGNQIVILEGEITKLNGIIAANTNELASLNDLRTKNESQASKLSESRFRIEDGNKTIAALQNDVFNGQASFDAERTRLQDERDLLKKQLQEQSAAFSDLQQKFASVTSALELSQSDKEELFRKFNDLSSSSSAEIKSLNEDTIRLTTELRDTTSHLQAEVERLEESRTKLQEQANTAGTEVVQLRNNFSNLELQITVLTAGKTNAEAHLLSARQKAETVENSLARAKNKLLNSEDTIAILRDDLAQHQDQLAEERHKHADTKDELHQQIKKLDADFRESECTVLKLKHERVSFETELAQLRPLPASFNEERKQWNESAEKYETALSTLRADREKLHGLLSKSIADLNTHSGDLQTAGQRVDALQSALSVTKQQLAESQGKLQQVVGNQHAAISQTIYDKDQEIARISSLLDAERESRKNDIDRINATLAGVTAELEKKEKSYIELQQYHDDQNSALGNVRSDKLKAEKSLTSANNRIKELEGALDQKGIELQRLQQLLEEAKKNGRNANGDLGDEKRRHNDTAQDLARIQKLLQQAVIDKTQLQGTNANLSGQVESLKPENDQLKRHNEDLTNRLEEAAVTGKSDAEAIAALHQQLNDKVSELSSIIASKDNEVDSLTSKLSAAAITFASISSSFQTEQGKTQRLDTENARLKSDKEQLHRYADDLRHQVSRMKDAHALVVANFDKELDLKRQEITMLRTTIANLENELGTLRVERKNALDSLEAVHRQREDDEKKIAAAQKLEQSISIANGMIDSLKSSIQAITGEKDALQFVVKNLKERIDSLDAELGEKSEANKILIEENGRFRTEFKFLMNALSPISMDIYLVLRKNSNNNNNNNGANAGPSANNNINKANNYPTGGDAMQNALKTAYDKLQEVIKRTNGADAKNNSNLPQQQCGNDEDDENEKQQQQEKQETASMDENFSYVLNFIFGPNTSETRSALTTKLLAGKITSVASFVVAAKKFPSPSAFIRDLLAESATVDPNLISAMMEICENGTPLFRRAIARSKLDAAFASFASAGFVTVESITNAPSSRNISEKLAAADATVRYDRIDALRRRLCQADPEVRFALGKAKLHKYSARLFSLGYGSLKELSRLEPHELERCIRVQITPDHRAALLTYLNKYSQTAINEVVRLLEFKKYEDALEQAGYGTALSVFAHPDALVAARTGMNLEDVAQFKKNLPHVLELDGL